MTVATIDTAEQVGALTVAPTQTFWTDHQRAALVQLGVDAAGDADLSVFLQQCQRTGLDPFARQIYMIGRPSRKQDQNGNWYTVTKWTIQTGIDGFRVIAERSGRYAGQTDVEWCGADGVWRDVWTSSEAPVAARAGVYRSDFAAPLRAVAHFDEYAPRNKSGYLTGMWPEKPKLMLAKVAEALSLRKAFPNDLSGLYVAEEMERADVRPSEQDGRTKPVQDKGQQRSVRSGAQTQQSPEESQKAAAPDRATQDRILNEIDHLMSEITGQIGDGDGESLSVDQLSKIRSDLLAKHEQAVSTFGKDSTAAQDVLAVGTTVGQLLKKAQEIQQAKAKQDSASTQDSTSDQKEPQPA